MAGMPIWYELMTPEPAAVAPFYRAVLGWDIPDEAMSNPNGSEYRMVGRADGGHAGGVLTLSPMMAQGGAKPGWLPYFHVDDVDEVQAKAESLGGRTWMGGSTIEGVGRIAMLADPQGAPFYVMDPAPPPDNPDARSDVFKADAPGHCAWNELSTDDAEAEIAFYTDLLGWNVDGEMPMPGNNIYKFLACDGQRIGAIGSMKPPGAPSAWLPYFRVADIVAAGHAVEAHGGKIVNGPHEVPGEDVILVAIDPAGAAVAFVGKKGQ